MSSPVACLIPAVTVPASAVYPIFQWVTGGALVIGFVLLFYPAFSAAGSEGSLNPGRAPSLALAALVTTPLLFPLVISCQKEEIFPQASLESMQVADNAFEVRAGV